MAASRARSAAPTKSATKSARTAAKPATADKKKAVPAKKTTAAKKAAQTQKATSAKTVSTKTATPKPHALRPAPKRLAPVFDRLEVSSIHVANMERAVAFYRDTLGLRAAQIWPNWAEFPLKGGVLLGVHLESDCGPGGRRAGGATGLYFPVTGIRRVVTQLRKRGVTITSDVTRHSYGTVAYFADPDGNEFGLIDSGA